MIQYSKDGEAIVEIPGRGLILGFRPQMQRVFGQRLIGGRVMMNVGPVAVDWDLQGYEQASLDDPAVILAREELLQQAASAEQAAKELTQLLRALPPGSNRVRVHRDLINRMGGSSKDDHVFEPETEVRPLRDVLARTAAAVRRAIARGDFAVRDGHAMLYGWVFLPPNFGKEPEFATSVRLSLEPCEPGEDASIRVLAWQREGAATAIELIRRDAPEGPVRNTLQALEPSTTSGTWRFPSSDLPGESKYLARVTNGGHTADSNVVTIPKDPEVPPPVDQAVAPVGPMPPRAPRESDKKRIVVTPPIVVVDPAVPPPVTPQRKFDKRWLWLLLLLLLLLLLFLFWLFFPFHRTRADWDLPIVAEHLPRDVSDIDPVPVIEVVPITPLERGEFVPGFDPDGDAVRVVGTDPDSPPMYVDEGRVFVVPTESRPGSSPAYVGASPGTIVPSATPSGPTKPSDPSTADPVAAPEESAPPAPNEAPPEEAPPARELPEVLPVEP